MGVLGLNPVLIAAVGKDWPDYEAWLSRHGVDTSHVLVSTSLYTAHFMVTTDDDLNQIASFFPGAMSEARNIELGPIMEKTGRFDMVVISLTIQRRCCITLMFVEAKALHLQLILPSRWHV